MDTATFWTGLGESAVGIGSGIYKGIKLTKEFRELARLYPNETRRELLFRLFGTKNDPVTGKMPPSAWRPAEGPWVHPKGYDAISNSHWIAADWVKTQLNKPWAQQIVQRLGTTTKDLVNKLRKRGKKSAKIVVESEDGGHHLTETAETTTPAKLQRRFGLQPEQAGTLSYEIACYAQTGASGHFEYPVLADLKQEEAEKAKNQLQKAQTAHSNTKDALTETPKEDDSDEEYEKRRAYHLRRAAEILRAFSEARRRLHERWDNGDSP
ncbi:hypothetical protein CC80DRAFT_549221 [Byssothecium circinans]|uniref:Uncharacterized protein n=1 Tax=Byssothecium circinans TaxID=147558 RepID=A0A6A5TRH6_9PLEO|nr:hypothetical protein CC80DRAFT_549221 [Byssothecium circinans]